MQKSNGFCQSFCLCLLLVFALAPVGAADKVATAADNLLKDGIHENKVETVKAALARGADVNFVYADGSTPLMRAAEKQYSEAVVEILIKAKAKVNATDKEGRTALMRASMCAQGGVEAAKFLVAAGAKINLKDKNGFTALDHAAECSAQVREFLKSKKARGRNCRSIPGGMECGKG